MIPGDRPLRASHVRPLDQLLIFWTLFRRNPRLKLMRYAFSGIAVSVGYTVTVILLVDGLGWMRPTIASALSFVIWTPPSYLVHHNFSFLYKGQHFTTIIKFTVAFVARLGAASYTVYLAATIFDSTYFVGVFANWIVLPLVGYLIMDFWVFRTSKSQTRP